MQVKTLNQQAGGTVVETEQIYMDLQLYQGVAGVLVATLHI